MSSTWKKQFGDMNAGIVKITVAERVSQNCIQKSAPSTENPFPDNKLSQILKVKTLGNEVSDVLRPKMRSSSQPPILKMTLKPPTRLFHLNYEIPRLFFAVFCRCNPYVRG